MSFIFAELLPGSIASTNVTDTTITVTWLPLDHADGYLLTCNSSDGDVYNVSTTNATNATITGLVPGTEYTVVLTVLIENTTTTAQEPTTVKTGTVTHVSYILQFNCSL